MNQLKYLLTFADNTTDNFNKILDVSATGTVSSHACW
jgi:hypothetical protein